MIKQRDVSQGLAVMVVVVLVTGTLGCGPRVHVTRIVTDPEADVAYYERILEEEPDNARLQRRLEWAKSRLARDLAIDSELAFQEGYPYEALDLARRAVEYDSRYASLEKSAREMVAQRSILESQRALARLDFDLSRSLLGEAERINPNSAAAKSARDGLDARESRFFRELAGEYQDDGDFEGALQAITRASDLRPNDADTLELRESIERQSRVHHVDGHIEDIEDLIETGQLSVAEMRLADLAEIEPEPAGLAGLLERVEARQMQAAELVRVADSALTEGQYDEAITLLDEARDLNSEADTSLLWMEAKGGQAKAGMLGWIEAGNRLEALLAARRTLEYVRDPDVERLVPQLELAFVEDVVAEARRLAGADRRDEALARVLAASQIVDSEQLASLLKELG